jgi:hypothetical protein
MIFLLDYDRKSGQLREFKSYQDHERPKAQLERLGIELSAKDDVLSGAREVVLLEADDARVLYRTHQRYFSSVREIVASFLADPKPA